MLLPLRHHHSERSAFLGSRILHCDMLLGDACAQGTIKGQENAYTLDSTHTFEVNRPVLVCGNTAAMLGENGVSHLAAHFKVGSCISSWFCASQFFQCTGATSSNNNARVLCACTCRRLLASSSTLFLVMRSRRLSSDTLRFVSGHRRQVGALRRFQASSSVTASGRARWHCAGHHTRMYSSDRQYGRGILLRVISLICQCNTPAAQASRWTTGCAAGFVRRHQHCLLASSAVHWSCELTRASVI